MLELFVVKIDVVVSVVAPSFPKSSPLAPDGPCAVLVAVREKQTCTKRGIVEQWLGANDEDFFCWELP